MKNEPHTALTLMSRTAPAPWWKAILLAAVICSLNFAFWAWTHQPSQLPSVVGGKLAGMAYAPFRRDQSPMTGQFPSLSEIREDLALLAPLTHAIRTYSSTEIPEVPALAAEFGLTVNAGAWIDNRSDNNRRELEALITAASKQSNITHAMVGNEAILRGDLSMAELAVYLNEARARLDIPVSTAENWDFWIAHPEYGAHVDYIAVHLLPYWEGVNHEFALQRALDRLTAVRAAFPKHEIVVGEVGWPSAGERFQDALPSLETQARFVREFANVANALGIEFYLMEAIDQPWKMREGRVGAYWGMFDSDRQLKWGLSGPVQSDQNWQLKALIAALIAFPENPLARSAAIVLMFAHGISIALLFGLADRIERSTGTLDLQDLGGLAKSAPGLAFLFGIAAMASIGLPGLANFSGEILVFLAAFASYDGTTGLGPVQIACILSIWGVVISAVYMLRAYRNIFQGPAVKLTESAADVTLADRIPATLLVLALFAVGLYPNLLLNLLK